MPDMLILHYTGMDSAEAAFDWLTQQESGVSCHYLVDEEGRIAQLVLVRARLACRPEPLGGRDRSQFLLDRHRDPQSRPRFRLSRFPRRADAGGRGAVSRYLGRHAIPPARVLAHSDIAPGRKRDPGEKFDWERLARAGIGLWVPPLRSRVTVA